MIPAQIEHFEFGKHRVSAFIPDVSFIRKRAQLQPGLPFPFWSRIWHSSIGMCEYLAASEILIKSKKVTEIGAGLGLPSLLCSTGAREVVASDIDPEAVLMIEKSAALNGFNNMSCQTLDLLSLAVDAGTDIYLFSDINYATAMLNGLENYLNRILAQEKTVILSTPFRLVASPFLERLMPFCKTKQQMTINFQNEEIEILVLRLGTF